MTNSILFADNIYDGLTISTRAMPFGNSVASRDPPEQLSFSTGRLTGMGANLIDTFHKWFANSNATQADLVSANGWYTKSMACFSCPP